MVACSGDALVEAFTLLFVMLKNAFRASVSAASQLVSGMLTLYGLLGS